MGATYSVSFILKFTDEKGAVNALHDRLTTNYNEFQFPSFKEAGIKSLWDINDLMRVILAAPQGHVTIEPENGFTRYENDFDASYGWEFVLQGAFEVMRPFLIKGSKVIICPDNEKYVLEV